MAEEQTKPVVPDYASDEDVAEYEAQMAALRAKYPDYPEFGNIERLDLIMRREWAEKILLGEKRVEFRDFNDFYAGRLYDKATYDYCEKHLDDEEFINLLPSQYPALRQVETIHFHDYNNTWYLDVEVEYNDIMEATQEDADFLHEEYGCDDLYEDVEWQKKHPRADTRAYFVFMIRQVLATNLDDDRPKKKAKKK